MRQRISISESEWQVMKVLWGEAPRRARGLGQRV